MAREPRAGRARPRHRARPRARPRARSTGRAQRARPAPAAVATGPRAPFRFSRQPHAHSAAGARWWKQGSGKTWSNQRPPRSGPIGSPRVLRELGRGCGVRLPEEQYPSALRAAAIMRTGSQKLRRGFRSIRHLYLAGTSEPFCCWGRALPSPNMAGRGSGHVGTGLSSPPPAPGPLLPAPSAGRPRGRPGGECGPGRAL